MRELLQDKKRLSLSIIMIVYLVGLTGLVSPYKTMVASLTPVTLLLSFGLLLYNHEKFTKSWIAVLVLIFLAGYGVEVLGVKTGFPFGEYAYYENLGPKVMGVPLMIGVNWVMLIYCTTLVYPVSTNSYLQSAVGAFFMVLYDLVLEPVAIDLNFWQWEATSIPIENYVAWFAIAYAMHIFVAKTVGSPTNKIARTLYFIQLVFFTILNFT